MNPERLSKDLCLFINKNISKITFEIEYYFDFKTSNECFEIRVS